MSSLASGGFNRIKVKCKCNKQNVRKYEKNSFNRIKVKCKSRLVRITDYTFGVLIESK